MDSITFTALGTLDLRSPEGDEIRSVLAQPKRVALLAYLALARPRGHQRRDSLIGIFWPRLEQGRARHALNQAIYGLRSSLGTSSIVSRGDEELALDDTEVWCDVRAFEEAIEAGEARVALNLYRGDLLPGFYLSDAHGFEKWLDLERARLRDLAAAIAWNLSRDAETRADFVDAIALARRATDLSPRNEESVRRLMTLLDRTGDRAAAVDAYQSFAERLWTELELDPAPETRRIAEEIRARTTPRDTLRGARQVGGQDGPAASPPDEHHGTSERAPSGKIPRSPPAFQRRPAVGTLAVTLLGASLAVGAVSVLARRSSDPAYRVENPRRSFAVLPFDVVSDATESEWLATGAPSLLAIDLGGWEEVRVADRRHLAAIAAEQGVPLADATLSDALEMARAARVGTLVLGEILDQAGQLEIVVRAYDAGTGEEILRAEQSASATQDLRSAFDRIAGRLLDLGGAPEIGPDVRAATTGSLDAYREYVEGLDHLYEWRLAEAAAEFGRALELDSTFAQAYYRLAMTGAWGGGADPERVRSLARAAVAHGAALPERERRHILAFNALQHAEFDVARGLYAELTASDSTDAEAWFHRADVEYHDETLARDSTGRFVPRADLDLALVGFERAVEIDPSFHLGYGHLFELLEYLQPRQGFDAFLIPEDDRVEGEDPYVYLYPAWRDSAFYVVLEAGNTEAALQHWASDSISDLLRDRGIDVARRWANAAPTESRPFRALRDLYVETRSRSAALEAQRELLRLEGDTTLADRLILGTLYLANGIYDSALVWTDDALERGNVFFSESLALGVLLGTGQVDRALEFGLPATYPESWIPTPDGRLLTTEWRPAMARIRMLGVAGAGRPQLRQAVAVLWDDWSMLAPAQRKLLVCGRLQRIGPGLMLLDAPTIREWLAPLTEPLPFPECERARPALLAWAQVLSDSLPAAEHSLETVFAADGDLFATATPFELYLLASVAQATGRHQHALDLLAGLDRSRVWELYSLDVAPGFNWAIVTRSFLLRAHSLEAIGDLDGAYENYERFLAAWQTADADLQSLGDQARAGLERLGGTRR